jgi:uncharacterized protein (DUF433 family)
VKKPVRLEDEADAEYRAARRWYEDRVVGLGIEFFDAVDATFEQALAITIKSSLGKWSQRCLYNARLTGAEWAGVYLLQGSAMTNASRVVHSDPDILGGTPVFVGTRVPVKSLYDHLEAGDGLDEFLDSFPSVTREQAVAALELGREMTEAHVAASR